MFKKAEWPRKLRSQEWYGGTSRDVIYHRGWMKNQGYPHDLFDGRPVIGILNTWSDMTPCNGHLRELAEKVKAGVWEAGGFPMEVPVFSASENTFRPTAMMYRNLAALAIEETIRGQPMDGCVLLVGCDKTTPSLIMAAASVDLPSIVVTGGPMLNGYFRGERVGSGTHLWKFSEMVKAGEMTQAEFLEAEASMSRSSGTCNTMGTASTMASMAEALGMALSGNAAIPGVDSRRKVMAQLTGRRIVQMVKDDLKPSDIMTKQAFENAIRTNAAIGGSTNAVIHLLAMAGRVGIDLTLDDWDRCGRDVPTIVNLMPSGKYLMEEFFYAGGLPVVIKRLGEAGLLHKDALTVSGETMWDEVKDVVNWNEDVILPAEKALTQSGGIVVVRGNLAPKGAVLKPSAASPHLLTHRGRAVVFEDIDDYKAKINDDNLDIDETCIMVMKNCGPKGYPGMAEVGNMGLPPKGAEEGHHRHGAHLRRPHVRYGLRHRRAAHLAGSGGRRTARGGQERRHDRTRCAEPSPASRHFRRGTGAPACRMAAEPRSADIRLCLPAPAACRRSRHRRRPRLPQGMSWKRCRQGQPLISIGIRTFL
jgi:L-arabonate dehydrase